jgi:hypothetical protein
MAMLEHRSHGGPGGRGGMGAPAGRQFCADWVVGYCPKRTPRALPGVKRKPARHAFVWPWRQGDVLERPPLHPRYTPRASRPAMATAQSWSPVPPLTPTPPTQWPSSRMGNPPLKVTKFSGPPARVSAIAM